MLKILGIIIAAVAVIYAAIFWICPAIGHEIHRLGLPEIINPDTDWRAQYKDLREEVYAVDYGTNGAIYLFGMALIFYIISLFGFFIALGNYSHGHGRD